MFILSPRINVEGVDQGHVVQGASVSGKLPFLASLFRNLTCSDRCINLISQISKLGEVACMILDRLKICCCVYDLEIIHRHRKTGKGVARFEEDGTKIRKGVLNLR